MRSLPPGAFRIRRFGSLAGGPSESAGGAQRRSVRVLVAPWRNYCARCHVYVTGSKHEPGAMHPVEGLQCGLPLLYDRETGGTVELGRKYGMEMSADTVESITRIRDDYEVLRGRVLGEPPFRGCDVSSLSQINSALDRGGPLTLVQAGKRKADGVGWAVHFAGDQQIKWALDEDLRWARQALDGEIAGNLSLAKPDHPRGLVAERATPWERYFAKPEGYLLQR